MNYTSFIILLSEQQMINAEDKQQNERNERKQNRDAGEEIPCSSHSKQELKRHFHFFLGWRAARGQRQAAGTCSKGAQTFLLFGNGAASHGLGFSQASSAWALLPQQNALYRSQASEY